MRTIEDVLSGLRAEFLEMPGLRLNPEQVQRLCHVERTICQMMLDVLVEEKFLCVKLDGRYAHITTGRAGQRDEARQVVRKSSVMYR